MAKITLKNVCKTFKGEKGRDVAAVKNLDLEAADRELLVLVGPSGCGKSTILRMIAGLESPTEGDISIGDHRVNDTAPKGRDVAMVFQNHTLYPHLSVRENIAFGMKLRKDPKAEIDKRVSEAAKILDIESLLDRMPAHLSGGQQQRVALGRAIVRKPKAFLFDEPLSNLDPFMRSQMRLEITRLHQRLQTTMIYVTHDQVEAMTMGQRIVVLNDGVTQQTDTPLALYNQPKNLFVAGFLGSPPMNFIRGKLKSGRDESIAFAEAGDGVIQVTLPDSLPTKSHIGRDVILGIRPDDLELWPGGEKAPDRFQVLVDAVEPLGSESNVHLQTGAHTLVCRSRKVTDPRDAGHRMQFSINVAKAHLFDPETANRLA